MEELIEWLKTNKIEYTEVDDDVISINGIGEMYYEDVSKLKSIFRTNSEGDIEFNLIEDAKELEEDGIFYAVFKFGDNWYYSDIREEFKLNILKYIGERKDTVHFNENYCNLGCHTAFELLNGSFKPKEWVKKAKYLGHKYIGICDKNTMAALYNLQKECDAAGIKPVFGYSLTFVADGKKVDAKVYVHTNEGLQNLLRIQKAIMVDNPDKGTIPFEKLIQLGSGNVVVIGKCYAEWILNNSELVKMLEDSFDDILFQVDFSEYKAERIDAVVLKSMEIYFNKIYRKENVDPVLISDSYYLDKDDAENKIILNKIATGAAHEQSNDQYFKDIDEQYEYFTKIFDTEKWDIDDVVNACRSNLTRITDGAVARFENTRNFMPAYDLTPEEVEKYGTPHNMFTQLLEEGLNKLVPEEKREQYRKQMEYEKYVIESTNNVDYLLVQYDTVNWCRKNNILVGTGRGSAAGCLLLYLMGITLVDPIKYDLIFERFLLPERAGLYPTKTTIIGEDIEATRYVSVELANGKSYKIDRQAELMVSREGEDEPIKIFAHELEEDDNILFDNKDEIFTINEL